MLNAGGFKTGNDMLDFCARREAKCAAYLLGSVDGLEAIEDAYGHSEANHQRLLCLYNVTGEQLADVFTKYLREHPETRQFAAASLLLTVLMRDFPCR